MYPNGKIPLDKLIHLGGEHYLPAGTAARWNWIVQSAKSKYGVTLRITPGPNAYRWYSAQEDAKKAACARGRCQDAATPGYSSHGGTYNGQESMAIDVDNWRDLAPGNYALAWSRFEALCRLAGFRVLLFSWEPWHIVDFNNVWVVPGFASGGTSKPTPTPTPLSEEEDEEDEMAMKGAHYPVGNKTVYLLFNEVSGFYVEHSGVPGTYNNELARNWGTNSWAAITQSHATVIKRSLDAVRRTAVTGSLSVDITDA